MARHAHGIGRKHHGPGRVRGPAPQFAVDEIAEAAGAQADGHHRHGEIRHREVAFAEFTGQQPEGEQHAQGAAVEAHAAGPDGEQPERVVQELAEVIEQHIADPATQDHAQRHIEHQVADLIGGPAAVRPPGAPDQQAPAADEADQVHQAVPVNLQGTQRYRHRVDLGKLHANTPSARPRNGPRQFSINSTPITISTAAKMRLRVAEGKRWLSRAPTRAMGKLVTTMARAAGRYT